MASKIDHEEFLKKLEAKNELYREGNFSVIGEYVNSREKIKVENKFGICEVSPMNLYKSIPSIETAVDKTDYYKKQFKEIHGDKYDYSLVDYKKSRSKVTINCPLHGDFKQSPHEHLNGQGCYECVRYSRLDGRRLTNDVFIDKAVKIHGELYGYSKVEINGNKQKVIIDCDKHGEFLQTPNSHLKGSGCKKCCLENNGYNKGKFVYFAKNNECTLYLLECKNETETFLKIGITSKSIKERFQGDKKLPYSFTILKEVKSSDPSFVWEEEVKIKKDFKNVQYLPKIKFKGYTECFNINIKEAIINHLNTK